MVTQKVCKHPKRSPFTTQQPNNKLTTQKIKLLKKMKKKKILEISLFYTCVPNGNHMYDS